MKKIVSVLFIVVLSMNLFSQIAYVLREDFESSLPSSWITETNGSNNNWFYQSLGSSDCINPSGALGMGRVGTTKRAGNNVVMRLITPVIDISELYRPMLSFSHAQSSFTHPNKQKYFDTLSVCYRTSSSDTWHVLAKYTNPIANWVLDTVLLLNYSNTTTYQIAFVVNASNYGLGVVLDSVRVFPTVICNDISGFGVEAKSTSATISIGADPAATNFELIVSESPISNLSSYDRSQAVYYRNNGSSFIYNVTGLDQKTLYYVYARYECVGTETGYSDWRDTSFTTTYGFPFNFVFDSNSKFREWSNDTGSINNANIGIPPQPNDETSNIWVFAPAQPSAKDPFFATTHIYSKHKANGTPIWFYSPAIDLSDVSVSSIGLSMDVALSGSAMASYDVSGRESSEFRIIISDDDGATWRVANTVLWSEKRGADYSLFCFSGRVSKLRVDLTSYKGKVIRVAIVTFGNSNHYYHVNNVSITSTDDACVVPKNLHICSVTDSSVNICWSKSNSTTDVVQVSDTVSFYDNTGRNYISLLEKTTSGNYTYSQLLPAKRYYVRVAQDCEDSVWNTISFVTSHTLPYNNPFTSLSSFPVTWSRYSNIAISDVISGENVLNAENKVSSNSWSVVIIGDEFEGMSGNGLYTSIGDVKNDWLVSPSIYLSTRTESEGVRLSFLMAYSSDRSLPVSTKPITSAVSFDILVSTDGGKTWDSDNIISWSTVGGTYNLNDVSSRPYMVHVDLSKYNRQSIRIALHVSSEETDMSNHLFINKFNISRYDTDCGGIENVHLHIGSADCSVVWQHFGRSSVLCSLSLQSDFSSLVSYRTVRNDTCVFTGLSPQTTYYLRLQQEGCADYFDYEFTTYCVVHSGSYYMDFEGLAEKSLPECWNVLKARKRQEFPYVSKNEDQAYNGEKELNFGGVNSFGQRSFLSMLSIENIVQYELRFWVKGSSSTLECNDKLLVGVMSDPMDSTTFYPLVEVRPGYYYEEYIVDLSYAYDNGNFITFVREPVGCNNSVFYSFYIDDISVTPLPTCHRMGNSTLTNITAHGLTLNLENTNASKFQILITKGSVDPQVAVDNDDPRIIIDMLTTDEYPRVILDTDKLESLTHYYVYVRGFCASEAIYGDWGEAMEFTTLCEGLSIEEFGVETFDDEESAICWKTGFNTIGNTSDNSFAAVRYTPAYGSHLYLSKERANTTTAVYNDGAYAVSRELNVGNGINQYEVSFRAASTNAEGDTSKLVIGVVTNPSSMATFRPIRAINIEYAGSYDEENTYTVSLKDYEGDQYGHYGRYVVFLTEAGYYGTSYVLIDDISFSQSNGCQQPYNIYIDSVQYTTAHIHWESTGADRYEICVQRINEMPNGANYIYHTFTTETTAVLSNLSATSKYYVFVRSLCGENYSRWSNGKMFKTKIGIPYIETFDEFPVGVLSTTGWTGYVNVKVSDDQTVDVSNLYENLTNEEGWWIVNKPDIVGNLYRKVVRSEIYGNRPDAMMVSPSIRLLGNKEDDVITMSFKACFTSSSASSPKIVSTTDQSLTVLVSEDGTHFEPIAKWTCDGTTNYDFNAFSLSSENQQINLTQYANKTVYLAFFTTALNRDPDMYFYIDSVEIKAIDRHCSGVMDVSVETSGKTATVKWSLLGTPSSVVVELFDDVNYGNKVSEKVSSVGECTFEGLKLNTHYYIRCRQEGCAGRASYCSFMTAYKLPFEQTFNTSSLSREWIKREGELTDVFNGRGFNPMMSTTYNGWDIASTEIGLNANHLVSYFYPTTGVTDYGHKWLISPEIDLSQAGNDKIYISFNVALTTNNQESPSSVDGIEFGLVISEDGGKTWLRKNAWLWTKDSNVSYFYKPIGSFPSDGRDYIETIDISHLSGKIIRLGFYENNNGSDNNVRLHIANVRIYKDVSDCEAPRGLSVVERGIDATALTWRGDPGKKSILEWARDEHFSIQMQRCTLNEGLTASATNLESNTVYYARVKQVCSGDDETFYSEVLTFKSSLGLPFEESFTDLYDRLPDEWSSWTGLIDDIVLGGDLSSAASFKSESWGMDNTTYGISGWHLASDVTSVRAKWCVSPVIDLSKVDPNTTGVLFSFDVALTNRTSYAKPKTYENQDFAVLVSTDEGKTWSKSNMTLWRENDANAYGSLSDIPQTAKRYTLDFSQYAGRRICFAFYNEVYYDEDVVVVPDNRIHIANVTMKGVDKSCYIPFDLKVSNISLSSATVSWSGDSHQNGFILEYSTSPIFSEEAGGKIGEIIITGGQGTSVLITKLLPGTVYYVRIKQYCDNSRESEYSEVLSFRTLYGIPFIETFNSSDIPNDWEVKQGDVDDVFSGVNLTTPFSIVWRIMGAMASMPRHLGASLYKSNGKQWIISPSIDLTSNSGQDIRFSCDLSYSTSNTSEAPKYYQTEGDELRLLVSEDDGLTWKRTQQFVWSDAEYSDANISAIPLTGKNYSLDFSQYGGKKIRIAFYQNADPGRDNIIHISNVAIDTLNPRCSTPSGIQITAMVNGALIEWQGNPEYTYIVQYSSDNSFSGPLEERRITGKCNTILSNLVVNQRYYLRIKQQCEVGSTDYSDVVSFTPALAFPFEESFNKKSIPTNWILSHGSISGAFKNNLPTEQETTYWGIASNSIGLPAKHLRCEIDPNKSNYWIQSPNIDLTNVEEDTTVALTFDFAYTRANSTEAPLDISDHSLYLLLSTDGGNTWTKTNTWLWTYTDTLANYIYSIKNIPTTGQKIVIDLSDFIGKSICFAFVPVANNFTPNSFHIANVRVDYFDPACALPVVLKTESYMTTCSVQWKKWNELPIILEYSTDKTFSDPASIIISDAIYSDRYKVRGLDPGVSYWMRLKLRCPMDDADVYSAPFSIKTLTAGQTSPNRIVVSEITAESALLTWTKTYSDSFEIRLMDMDDNESYYKVYDNTVFRLSGLVHSSNYRVSVRSLFEDGVTSSWVDDVNFSTACKVSLPVSYNFDDRQRYITQSNYEMQNCWKTNSPATIYLQDNAFSLSYSRSSTTSICMHQNGGSPVWLAMPEIEVDDDLMEQYILSFNVRACYDNGTSVQSSFSTSQYSHKIKIGTVSNINDFSTFHLLKEFELNEVRNNTLLTEDALEDNFWEEVTVNLVNGHGKQIVFLSDYDFSNHIYIDDVSLESKSGSCVTSDSVWASVRVSTATIRWKADGSDSHNLVLIENNAIVKRVEGIVGDQYTFNQLTQNTDYILYVYAVCGGVEGNGEKVKFHTRQGLPFYDDFNGSSLVSLWSQFEGKLERVLAGKDKLKITSYKWVKSENTDITGSSHAKLNLYGTSTYYWLVSPLIDLSEQTSADIGIRMSFDLALTLSKRGSDDIGKTAPLVNQTDDRFAIIISVDSGRTWETVAIWASDNSTLHNFLTINEDCRRIKLDLSSYAGKTIQVAFYGESTISNADNDIHIDNVRINQYSLDCAGIDNLRVRDVSTSGAKISFEYLNAVSTNKAVVILSKQNNRETENVVKTAILSNSQSEIEYSDLEHSTVYYVFISQDCEGNENVEWESLMFKTKYSIPYTERFSTRISADWQKKKGWIDNIVSGSESLRDHSTYSGWSYTHIPNALNQAHPYLEIKDTNTHYWLISPPVYLNNVDDDGIHLSFDAVLTSSLSTASKPFFSYGNTPERDDRLCVAITLDSGQTWQVLYDAASNLPDYVEDKFQNFSQFVQEVEVDMTDFANKTVQVAIYGESSVRNVDNYFHISNFEIGYFDQNCQGVKNIRTDQIDIESARVDYEFRGPGRKDVQVVLLQHCIDTFILSSGRQIITDNDTILYDGTSLYVRKDTFFMDTFRSESPYLLPLLNYNKYYTLSIRQLCDGDNLSKDRKQVFRTSCGIPYKPDNAFLMSDWKVFRGRLDSVYKDVENMELSLMSNQSWTYSEATSTVDRYHFRGETFRNTAHNWLVSPTIDLTRVVGSGVMLSFDARLVPSGGQTAQEQRYLGSDDKFVTLISDDDGKSWSPNNATIWDNQQTGDYDLNYLLDNSASYYINLSDFTGNKVKIAFYIESTVDNTDNYLYLSNIRVDTVPTETYSFNVCLGSDFTEKGFTIPSDDLSLGLNVYSRYTPSTRPDEQGVLEVLRLNVDSRIVTMLEDVVCLNSRYVSNDFDTLITSRTRPPLVRFLSGKNGCDSIIELRLTITRPITKNISEERCLGVPFIWNGEEYYTSRIFSDTMTSQVTGCDSITRIFLTVKSQFETQVFDTLCFGDSMIIGQSIIKTSGLYEDRLLSDDGCDSLVIHNVLSLPYLRTHKNIAICEGESYVDETFREISEEGIYEEVVRSVNGCDSVVSVKLLIADEDNHFYDTLFTDELPYIVNGMALLPIDAIPGDYERNINIVKCGASMVYIHLKPREQTGIFLSSDADKMLSIVPNVIEKGGMINFVTNFSYGDLKDVELTIFNTSGQVVKKQVGLVGSLIVRAPDIPGLYFVQVQSFDIQYIGTIIVY